MLHVERDRFYEPEGDYFFNAETYAHVATLLDTHRKQGTYTWPYRMRSSPPGNRTYEYLLAHKYKVSSRDIRPDCMEERWFTLYDSLMDGAIVQRYGADFYARTYLEAVCLERGGQGLTLPYVVYPDSTISAIRKALPFWDTLTSKRDGAEFGKSLYIAFNGDNIKDVFIGTQTVLLFELEEFAWLKKEIITRLNCLHWIGPKFRGRKIKAAVIFNDREGTFQFKSEQ